MRCTVSLYVVIASTRGQIEARTVDTFRNITINDAAKYVGHENGPIHITVFVNPSDQGPDQESSGHMMNSETKDLLYTWYVKSFCEQHQFSLGGERVVRVIVFYTCIEIRFVAGTSRTPF